MRLRLCATVLVAVLVAGCVGSPVRRVVKQAGSIEIATLPVEALVHDTGTADTGKTVGGVAAAGAVTGLACGPVAVVCSPLFGLSAAASTYASITLTNWVDGLAAPRVQGLAEQLRNDAPPEAFLADLVANVRRQVSPTWQDATGPPLKITLAISRLELLPIFPASTQLIVWIEVQAWRDDAASGKPVASRRFVHLGDIWRLRSLDREPDRLAREVAIAKAQLTQHLIYQLRR